MEKPLFVLLVLLTVTNLPRELVVAFSKHEKLAVKQQLNLLNKPSVKSFQTEYGDILDCVEINKQLAFDHPSLKNHSIQIKPFQKMIAKHTTSSHLSSKIVLPKARCPRGTVPIKRITEEDLIAMEKFRPSLAVKYPTPTPSKFAHALENEPPQTDHIATIVAFTKNYGVGARVNVWSPEVKDDHQFSSVSLYVASDDGPVSNAIAAGWSVNPYLYQNFTRLNTLWTKDSSRSTGCFNMVCPGFVQISQHVPLGFILHPISEYNGPQFDVDINIEEDEATQNWWLNFQGEPVGYWPKELFSTLTQGATRAGWGGEVNSPLNLGTPPMGGGHFPIEGFGKACFIRQMKIADDSHTWVSPSADYIKQYLTNPLCFKISYDGSDKDQNWGHFMYVGGPPNCKL